MKWKGVMPAITTCFDTDLKIDHGFVADHCRWLIRDGCTGIVALGSLGEGATLQFDEKIAILNTCRKAVPDVPLVAAISALSTAEAVRIAKAAEDAGCDGLMVLPPYVYPSDWREMKAHIGAVLRATRLSSMLYNNPVAYVTDFLPEQVEELAQEHDNLHAVKESSTDARRVAGIKALTGERLAIFVGVDDAILEGIGVGAVGWVAGLVNALPAESVELFELGLRGDREAAFAIYKWFLPLLRMDTVVKFVQLIKLVQQEVGMGNARVRPPRLELTGAELEQTLKVIRQALANRPSLTERKTVAPARG